MTIRQFGYEVHEELRSCLQPVDVSFQGSFASGKFDQYSDVDLQAKVHEELTQEFYNRLMTCLERRFGPLTVRYDPDYRYNLKAQGLRISFNQHPVFWRIDLSILSERECEQKWPSPFPRWSIATSAFWNIVWAVKRSKRGEADADHYMHCACEKLVRERLDYTQPNVDALLSDLRTKEDVDNSMITKLEMEMRGEG